MSVVSHAGPWFNLARRRLKKPRTPGRIGFVRHGAGMIPASDYTSRRNRTRAGRPQFGAHHRRRLARPARQLSGYAGPAARRPIAFARPCSIGCSMPSRALAASICSPAPARSGSRRCRAAPGEVVFVEQAGGRARALQEQLARFGRRGAGREWWKWAPRAICAAPGGTALRHRVSGSAVRTGCLGGICSPARCRRLAASRAAWCTWKMNGRPACPHLPPHWELLKSKSAGEVGYHLARVNARA